MSTKFKAGVAAATAAVLLCASGASAAASPIPSAFTNGTAATQQLFQSPTPLAASLLAQTLERIDAERAVDAPNAADELPSARASSFNAFAGFGNLRGNADLLLWNLCAVVRAHQQHHAFERIDLGIDSVKLSEDIAKVSAVPLPGAIWLFVMGVLGLAGTRVTGIGRRKEGGAVDAGPRGPGQGAALSA